MSQEPNFGTNFYEAVNRKWLDDPANAIPAEYPTWGGFRKLADEALLNQIRLVSELCELSDRTPDQERIAAIYNASVERFKAWDDGTATYATITLALAQLNRILTSNDPEILADYMHHCFEDGISNYKASPITLGALSPKAID